MKRSSKERSQAVVRVSAARRTSGPPQSTDKFLSDASAILSATIDYSTAFDKIAHLAVPFLADWCAIDVVEPSGEFQRVAAAHVDPEKVALPIELQARFAPDPKLEVGYPKVLRTGEPEFWPEVLPEQLARAARSPEHLDIMQRLGFHSYMCVPLMARNRTLGSMTFVSASASRHFTRGDLSVAEELGRRAGMTLDNARLLHETDRARRRAALLAETSRLLAASANPRALVWDIARLCVGEIGDWCAIRLKSEDDAEPIPPVLVHRDPKMLPVAREIGERWPFLTEDLGPARVLVTGKTEFYPVLDSSHFARASKDAAHAELLKNTGARSAIFAPIKIREEVSGTLTFVSAGRFTEADVQLVEDLAYRIALALENARLHASAAEAIRARDELFSVASHEMRTPLGALHLMMRVLRNSVDSGRSPQELATELAGKIEIADRQVSRVAKLVNKLLDISKLKAGRLLLEREDLDLSEVAREAVARFEEDARRLGSSLTLVASEPVHAFQDRFRLEQTFTNLISNAIKYGAGKPIEVAVETFGEYARIIVRDHGIGISAEQRQRLFERHARGQRAYEGLGLGLYIVRQIVEEAGGTIDLESEVGKGSTFIVQVPLHPK